MIVEIILSSINPQGNVNFAPMGLHIPDNTDFAQVREGVLRLYPGSESYENLRTMGEGVVNFSDNVSTYVDTALYSQMMDSLPSTEIRTPRLAEARRVWEFKVGHFNSKTIPSLVEIHIVHREEKSGFNGFCRAQGAVLEATIAATRWGLLPKEKIVGSWPLWLETVQKTGGSCEREAFTKVSDYLRARGIEVPGINDEERNLTRKA